MPDEKDKNPADNTVVLTKKEMMYSIYQKQSGSVPQAFLICDSGPDKGKEFLLAGAELTLGRAGECNITLNDSTISGHHASIICEEGIFFVKDAGSLNGTFLNEKKVEQSKISPGDRIRIGNTLLRLTVPAK